MRELIVFLIVLTVNGGCGASVNSSFGDDTSQLLSVVTLYRHGDRAPSISFPNDPYFDESYWPMGHGQLTNKGKRRLYELGRWFRSRYSSFLPEDYSPKDIYVRSTNADRCLMSAYLVLAGLYAPGGSQTWNRDLPWQPIPVHTVPNEEDEVLAMRKYCGKYAELSRGVLESKPYKKISATYGDFFKYVAKHTGWSGAGIRQIGTLYIILDIYRSYNASFLPAWTKSLDKRTLSYLAGLDHQTHTFTTQMKRLLTGPFWANLMGYFDNVVNNVTGTPRFLMLSAHDLTVASLLNCMGAYDLAPPNFAATLIWELRRSSDGEHFVNLVYKRTGPEPDALTIRGCGANCAYASFKALLEPVTVDTAAWEEECASTDAFGSLKHAIKLLWANGLAKKDQRPFSAG